MANGHGVAEGHKELLKIGVQLLVALALFAFGWGFNQWGAAVGHLTNEVSGLLERVQRNEITIEAIRERDNALRDRVERLEKNHPPESWRKRDE